MQKMIVGPETERMVELGHPWVIADRYTKAWPKGHSGDLITLVNERGTSLATALHDPDNRIVARVVSRDRVKLSVEWFIQRLQQAKSLRRHAQLEDTDAHRWVNGEGDGLPGITLDRYADYLMLQFYSCAWEPHQPQLMQALQTVFKPRGIYLKPRPQNTRGLEARRSNKKMSRLLAGAAAPAPLEVKENGLLFLVDLSEGLNTGLFADQRRNRREIMARSSSKRVLNLFAFTGAFSVAAAAAGAKRVTSIDVSDKYLELARDNFSLNRLNPKRHEFIHGDVFVELARLRKENRCFDLIIFDPPSFSTTRKSHFSTQGGTAKLVSETLPLLESGGLLVASSNHQKVGLDEYIKQLRRGALEAKTELAILMTAGQADDFPVPVTFPEGRYLKFVIGVKK